MCLIINKPAGAALNFKEFEIAVKNNPDGYGLSFSDNNGSLTTIRNPNTPDPEVLFRTIQEDLDQVPTMIHLRYTTVGETNMRNAHPFPVLEKKKHGVDLRMCHNGTIPHYKGIAKKGESDSRCFVRTLVRPLFERLIKGHDIEEILDDKWVYNFLDSELPTHSVITFLSGNGDFLEVNPLNNTGKYENGIYYSNTYSFDPSHRDYGFGSNWPQSYRNPAVVHNTSVTSITNQTQPEEKVTHALDTKQKKFTEIYDTQLSELYCLDDDFIDNLVTEEPGDAAALIKELILELEIKTYGGNYDQ
jgi:hypothetical protein